MYCPFSQKAAKAAACALRSAKSESASTVSQRSHGSDQWSQTSLRFGSVTVTVGNPIGISSRLCFVGSWPCFRLSASENPAEIMSRSVHNSTTIAVLQRSVRSGPPSRVRRPGPPSAVRAQAAASLGEPSRDNALCRIHRIAMASTQPVRPQCILDTHTRSRTAVLG